MEAGKPDAADITRQPSRAAVFRGDGRIAFVGGPGINVVFTKLALDRYNREQLEEAKSYALGA